MRPFRTIRARLALLAVLPLAPLLAIFAHASLDLQRAFKASEIIANLEVARASAGAFSGLVGDVARTALPVGEAIARGHLAPEEQVLLLERTVAEYASVRELSWTSPSGTIVLSSNPSALGVEVRDREYFGRLLRGDDVAVSDLLRSHTGDGHAFVIARAVHDPSRRLLGAVLTVVDPELLGVRALSTERIGDAALTLVDRAGRIVFRSPPAALPWEEREIASSEPLLRRALRGEEATGTFTLEPGGDRLGAIVPVPEVGWVVLASRRADEAMAPVRRELAESAVVGLVVTALALAAATHVGGRIRGSLRRLEAHAAALGRGERPDLPRLGAPEAQRLARAYADMAARIQRARDRLQLLHECGKELSESLEVEEVARRLARCGVRTVADWATVEELASDGSLRPVAVGHADPAREEWWRRLRELHPPSRESPTWLAISERRTVFIPEVTPEILDAFAAGPEHRALLRRAGLRSWVSAPIVTSGSVLGVVSFATAAGRALDPGDVQLVEEMARRAAQAIANARLFRRVQRAVRSRDEVLAVVSHDLRNPLGAMMLGARLVADLPDGRDAPSRARATGRRMVASGQRMARLIDDLLDLASLREGRLAIEPAACPPGDLLRAAAEDLRGAAAEKGLELGCEAVAAPLPEVACDPQRALQVLENLVSNAIKATAHGRVWLAAEPHDGEVIFSVSDTGPGITPEEQALLFEPFRRGASAAYRGTGLGLAISRALVEAHGGRIWIESRPGAGTTVSFTLPVWSGAEEEDGFEGRPRDRRDQAEGEAGREAATSGERRPSTVP